MKKKDVGEFILAALFISGEPIEIDVFGKIARMDNDEITEIVDKIIKELDERESGLRLIRINNGLQLCTNPKYADYLKLLFSPPIKEELSKSVMETLSIIAYRQPITRAEIDDIRGVNSNYAVAILKNRGLVKDAGKKNVIGHPILLGTTEEFLRQFGISSLNDLPKINTTELSQNEDYEQNNYQ